MVAIQQPNRRICNTEAWAEPAKVHMSSSTATFGAPPGLAAPPGLSLDAKYALDQTYHNDVLALENARLMNENARLQMAALQNHWAAMAHWAVHPSGFIPIGTQARPCQWPPARHDKHIQSNSGADSTSAGSSCSDSEDSGAESEHTTIIMKQIPAEFTRDMLLKLLNTNGFEGFYDFLYIPRSFDTQTAYGYAFINFTTSASGSRFRDHFQGFKEWECSSDKEAEVDWANGMQGFKSHVDRYRNSPTMHPHVPDELKPVLFQNGVRVEFPPPTKKIQAPRMRRQKVGGDLA